MTKLFYLKSGDRFRYKGELYIAEHINNVWMGNVICLNVRTGKREQLYIDAEVERVKEQK